ncbi:MAG: amino acid permease, partial [Candidatus Korobacteraceae bacterium]
MTDPATAAVSRSRGLRRELGLGSAAAAVAGEAIAVGIFLTPAGMAKSLGSPFWLLMVWLVMGGITISGALCFGELAGRYPQAGGLYVYLREAFGERVAFLYGWMSLLVMDPGVTAALAVGGAGYGAYIFGWSPLVTKLMAVATVAALCAINMVNTRAGAGFLRYVTWLKLGVLALIVVWALVFRLGSWSHFVPFVAQRPGSAPLLPAIAGALVAAFYSYGGWWDVSKIAGEVKDPARTLPRALVLGVLAVVAAYVLVSAVFVYLIPPESVTSDHTFVAQAGAILFGRSGANLLAGAVVLCIVGGMAAMIMLCPRVYYAMARDGVFLPAVAKLHPVFG